MIMIEICSLPFPQVWMDCFVVGVVAAVGCHQQRATSPHLTVEKRGAIHHARAMSQWGTARTAQCRETAL